MLVRESVPTKEGLRLLFVFFKVEEDFTVRESVPTKEGLRLAVNAGKVVFISVRESVPTKEGLRQFKPLPF